MTAIQRQAPQVDYEALERVVAQGDLSKLTSEQRVNFIQAVCRHAGVNPLLQPIEFITFQGRSVPYVKRSFTDQLRANNNISITIISKTDVNDVHMVTARATTPAGRTDESVGAVNIAGLKGEALANAYMKAETKAKRRVTLAICGLGLLDESELDTMKGFQRHDEDLTPKLRASIDAVSARKALNAMTEATLEEEVQAVRAASVSGQAVDRRQSSFPPPIGYPTDIDAATEGFDPNMEEPDAPVDHSHLMTELDKCDTAPKLNRWYAVHSDYIKAQPTDVKNIIREQYVAKRKELGMKTPKKSS